MERQTLGVGIFVGLGTLLLTALPLLSPAKINTDAIIIIAMFLMMFGVPSFLLIHAYFRCRITASQHGLEIRGMFGKQFIEWSEIRDFYFEVRTGDSKTHYLTFIEYGTRKQLLSQLFENRPALIEYIEQQATNARARKFEFKETRDLSETPIVFDYGNPKIWPFVLLALGLGLLMLGNLLFNVTGGIGRFTASLASYSWPMKLGFIAVILCFCALYPLIVMALVPPIKTLQKYKGQQIIASKSGLEWRNGANKTQILWEQIQNYYRESVPGHLQSSLCVVESERERIAFLYNIPRGPVLRLLIEQNATNVNVSGWNCATGHDKEVLGKASTFTENGDRIFHYKSRTNRAMLVGITVICLTLVLINSFSTQLFGRYDPAPLHTAIFLSIPLTYGWIAYFRSRCIIEQTGLRCITLIGNKFITWDEIQNLKIDLFYSITGNDKTVRVSQFLAEPAMFKTTVAKRSGKEWTPETSDAVVKH